MRGKTGKLLGVAMCQDSTTVIGMPPQAWKPTTDEQREAIAKLDEVAARVHELWGIVDAARKLGVPKDVIARHLEGAVSRATIYRRLDSEKGASSS